MADSPSTLSAPGWWPRLKRHVALDLTPLRESREYRLLFTGQFVSAFGSAITYVILPWQMFQLTQSTLYVGLLGLAEFFPMFFLSFAGGPLAEAMFGAGGRGVGVIDFKETVGEVFAAKGEETVGACGDQLPAEIAFRAERARSAGDGIDGQEGLPGRVAGNGAIENPAVAGGPVGEAEVAVGRCGEEASRSFAGDIHDPE